jgi:hypothetical protein
MICFAVGYAAISRRLINTGAFYTLPGHRAPLASASGWSPWWRMW